MGAPIAYGAGFIALLIVAFSTYIGRYVYFYAAAGGPLLKRVGLAQPIYGFWLYGQGVVGNEAGVTAGGGGWATLVLAAFSRYAAPPLFGLAGAALIASGNPWAVLLAATILSILALLVAKNPLAFTIRLLVVLGLGAALLYGSAEQQAFAATFVVWFLLIAGTVWAFRIPAGKGSTESLPRRTLIPGVVWRLVWIVVAIVPSSSARSYCSARIRDRLDQLPGVLGAPGTGGLALGRRDADGSHALEKPPAGSTVAPGAGQID